MKFHYTGSKSELVLSILYFLTLMGLLIYTGAQCGKGNNHPVHSQRDNSSVVVQK
jgi:hypothetical protein